MAVELDGARLVWGTVVLAYAAYVDVRTRRVPNAVWIEGAAVASALLAWDLVVNDSPTGLELLFVALFCLFAYVLWFLRVVGGADAKALMVVALLVPSPFTWRVMDSSLPELPLLVPPYLAVYFAALICFLLLPAAYVVSNVARGHVRFPFLLLGTRVPIERVNDRFVWVMERAGEEGRTHFISFSSRWTPEKLAENLAALQAQGRRHVWVTPKVPFMVPLLGGFLLTFVVGDLFTALTEAMRRAWLGA